MGPEKGTFLRKQQREWPEVAKSIAHFRNRKNLRVPRESEYEEWEGGMDGREQRKHWGRRNESHIALLLDTLSS